MTAIRVGTRGSPLALRQAELVVAGLRALGPGRPVEVVPIKTSGDRLAQVTLADFGGKGLFVKEIEEALLEGRVDLAVHSLKDLPAELPAGLCLAAYLPRENPQDVLVSTHGGGVADLPAGAVVGTSSLRRRVQLLAGRPDLTIEPIRGNLDTRLRKLSEGAYDAIVLAMAGLRRLGLSPAGAHPLAPDEFIPAVGQGVLVAEARASDRLLLDLVRGLDHTETRWEAVAERAFLRQLGASCFTPVAAHGRLVDGALTLAGLVASLDGQRGLRATVSGPPEGAPVLGQKLADELKAKGAAEILTDVERERG
ncbi:MAG: hydroxymethylbilane synthase [Candidatus Methylomirabilia bacterium]